jgi:hypothetical protein
MSAVYENFAAGQVSDDPLTLGATTINSAGFAVLPVVVAPDFLWLSLDPDGVDGVPEVVKVTAHAAAATSVTVVRGEQGTVAREHDELTLWRHAWTAADGLGLDSVGTAQLVDGAVTTAKIADGAVTNAKIASVTGGTLDGGRVEYRRLGNMVFVWSIGTAFASLGQFTLPAGFRPATAVLFSGGVQVGGVVEFAYGNIGTNGVVALITNSFAFGSIRYFSVAFRSA